MIKQPWEHSDYNLYFNKKHHKISDVGIWALNDWDFKTTQFYLTMMNKKDHVQPFRSVKELFEEILRDFFD